MVINESGSAALISDVRTDFDDLVAERLTPTFDSIVKLGKFFTSLATHPVFGKIGHCLYEATSPRRLVSNATRSLRGPSAALAPPELVQGAALA